MVIEIYARTYTGLKIGLNYMVIMMLDWSSDIVDNLDEESIKHIKDHIKEGDFIGQEMSEYSMDDGQWTYTNRRYSK